MDFRVAREILIRTSRGRSRYSSICENLVYSLPVATPTLTTAPSISPRRNVPASMPAAEGCEKFILKLLRAPLLSRPAQKTEPGMNATPYFLTAVSSRCVVSNASGNRTHTKTPESGRDHSEPVGNLLDSAANIISLRLLYSERKRSKCRDRKPESSMQATMCCENVAMSISDDSF